MMREDAVLALVRDRRSPFAKTPNFSISAPTRKRSSGLMDSWKSERSSSYEVIGFSLRCSAVTAFAIPGWDAPEVASVADPCEQKGRPL